MPSLLRRALPLLTGLCNGSAALLGARFLDRTPRWRCFFGTCSALLVTAAVAPPVVALVVLVVGLWLLVAVYLVWVGNEKQRGRIAKKIDNTPPDSLPRLQDVALFTAFAVPLFLLFLFEKAQAGFGLFLTKEAHPGQ